MEPCVEASVQESYGPAGLRTEFAKARRKIAALESALQRQVSAGAEREQRLANVHAQSVAELQDENRRLSEELASASAAGASGNGTSVTLERQHARRFIETWRAGTQKSASPPRPTESRDGDAQGVLMREIEALDRTVRDLQFKRARSLIRNPAGAPAEPEARAKSRTAEIETIRASGLLDEERYRTRVPTAGDAVAHYVAGGHDAHVDPHPLFAQRWYVMRYAKLLSGWATPFAHFLSVGWQKGCDPHPLFATRWYLAQNDDVVASGENPLAHFVTRGHREGRDPNPVFATAWYRDTYLGQAAADTNPLIHYLFAGKRGTCEPSPWFDTKLLTELHPRVRLKETNPLGYLLGLPQREIDDIVLRMKDKYRLAGS